MPTLEFPVRKDEWLCEMAEQNGSSSAKLPTETRVHEAGPWEPAVRKLVELLNLDDDWDGLGAKAPTCELVASAIGLAYLLNERGMTAPQRVVAGLDGSIIIEWQFPDGSYAEVEVVRPLFAEVMMVEPGQPTKHWTIPNE